MFLVTGGNGFIGSHVVRGLVAKGSKVVVYDSTPQSDRLASVADQIEYANGDLIEWETLFEAVKKSKAEAIVHLAYYRDIAEQEKRPLKATRINCLGFNNVLEVARLSGTKRVVWASSQAIYGPAEFYTEPVNEDAPSRPITLYGACKVYDEYLANHYTRQFGLETIGLRPAIVYGEGRWYSGYSSFARDLFVNALTGRPTVLDEADRRLNWTHVKDVAQGFVKGCFARNLKHNIFNLSGEVASIRQAAEIVKELVPKTKIEIRGGGGKVSLPAQLDWSRAREELGYQPEYGIRRGISEYLDILRKELGKSE